MINGNLKSLGPLWTNLAKNQRYEQYIEKSDLQTFDRRFANEGLTFLTSVLPNIGKAVDSFHSTSEWIEPVGFQSAPFLYRGWGDAPLIFQEINVPLFLRKAVICALKGDSIAVDCVRQLTLMFYKLEVDYGPEMVEQFLISFKMVDEALRSVFVGVDVFRDTLLIQMESIIKRVLGNSDPLDIVPSHGGGSTACRTPNWEKHHRALVYYEKLDDIFPYSDYFFFNYSHLLDAYERLENSVPGSVPRARVCLVPKDSRGPRVISCEPAEMMFIQQGIMRKLYKTLETNKLTSGYVNFTDQTINQELARLSSKGDLELATIDLSDASDRVSLELVRRVFPENWFEALNACRSEETELPNGEIVKLQKFAPMGSSCCFPVEALVFWACAQAVIQILGKNRHFADVFVYGDDIIIPVASYDWVVRGLESVGLKVNATKSYWTGPFRESCGGDFHLGVNVTPVRVRKDLSKSRTSIATNADLANELIAKFGYETVSSVISIIEDAGEYIYPRTELNLPGTIRSLPRASNDTFFFRRFNKKYQREEYRILRCISRSKERQPPNWEELFRKQLSKDRSSSSITILFGRDPEEETGSQYQNRLQKADLTLEPGWYTDPHAVVTTWEWVWLG